MKNDSETMAKLYKNTLDSLCWKMRERNAWLTKALWWSREGVNVEALGKVVEFVLLCRKLEENHDPLVEGFLGSASLALTAMRTIENGGRLIRDLSAGDRQTEAWDVTPTAHGSCTVESQVEAASAPQGGSGGDASPNPTRVQELAQYHRVYKACASYGRVKQQWRLAQKNS